MVEGTPDFLLKPLRVWLVHAVTLRDLIDLKRSLELRLWRNDIFQMGGVTGTAIMDVLLEGEELFEAVDAALDLHNWLLASDVEPDSHQWWVWMARDLMMILDEAHSEWEVNHLVNGLVRRVDPTAAQAVAAVVKDASADASAHLSKAWDKAYGFRPDPGDAYSEAVKAVEAAVIPVTIPRSGKPTLGTALKHLEDTESQWSLVIDDKTGQPTPARVVIGLIDLLWHGQRNRHAGGPTTKPISQETAEAAVHAAVTLVQWFTSGAIRKAP
ncbi:hypothetical protein GCM10022226_46800 [Sphaerisporangium flaviroseum]|uniref:TIGR02391 family protein n=2 Tax=Sphaerisporangium flaviroseum TaxID=509199 RepID=A0ABP7IL76_9ACTN